MSKRTWRQIEDSRDRRLWITQVGLPLAGFFLFWMSDPERREWTVKNAGKTKVKVVEFMKNATKTIKGIITC